MAAAPESVKWKLVTFRDEDKAASRRDDGSGADRLSDPSPAEPALDPDAFHLRIELAGGDPEIVAIDKDLKNAEEVIQGRVKLGYWVHGPAFFEAILQAINAPLANAYQGSQKPPRQLTQEQQAALTGFARKAIAERQEVIAKALLSVEQAAATYALQRLKASKAEIVASVTRYVLEAGSDSQVRTWLAKNITDAGKDAFVFQEEEGLELITSLFAIWGAYRMAREADARLARVMKEAGPEMQKIALDRWQYLRKRDRSRVPPATSYFDTQYDTRLYRATHPDARLVEAAMAAHPEPKRVLDARLDAHEAAGVLTSTVADEGAKHPVLHRIWSPRLAEELWKRFDRPDIQVATMRIFSPLLDFRQAFTECLRSAWQAANGLSDKISRKRSHVWRFPLLIESALDQMNLRDDDFTRVAAEHRVDQLLEEQARQGRFFAHASTALTTAGLLVRLVPAPAAALPASVVINVLDLAVGGLGELAKFLENEDSREGFRAFLAPGDSFAASDGSYLGTIIGAAFLLFGAAGLYRPTLAKPTEYEALIAGVAVAPQEYQALTSPGPTR